MSQPEFIKLDGQAVRVTSLKRDESSGRVEVVIVARGSVAAQALREIAGKPVVTLEIPDESSGSHAIVETDFRASGEGEHVMNRVRITLDPVSDSVTSLPEAEKQLDRIERKLDQLLTLFKNMRTEIGS